MKTVIALILLSAGPTVRLSAQNPDAVLDRAVAAFEKVTTLRAEFTQVVADRMIGTDDTSRGDLFHQRPNKFAMKWRHPAGDLILSDGQTLWIYLPSTAPQQVIRSDARGGQSLDVVAEFLDRPRERFTITYVKADTVGRRATDVLAFTPKAQNTAYRRVLVWIDRQDDLPRQFEITEASGTTRRIGLDRLQVNRRLPASAFVFRPPAGARVVNATQQ